MYKNHVCVCGYVHMHRYLHLCISVETRGEPWLSSSITLHLIFDARSLPESGTCEFPFSARLEASNLQSSFCLCLPGAGLTGVCLTTPGLLLGAGI